MAKYLMTAIMALLASACANSPDVQYYVLEPFNQPTPLRTAPSKPLSIGIGPVSLPGLLDRKKIVRRLSGNTVQISEFQQWATPLEENVLQTLTSNMASLQPNNIVHAYPWYAHGTVDLQIIVDIIRFDTTPGKSANLEANWTIKTETNYEIIKNGRTVIKQPLADTSYPGTVQALSKILGQFSQELSTALPKVEASH